MIKLKNKFKLAFDLLKKVLNFIKQYRWLVQHGSAATVAVILTLSFSWLVKNWETELVVNKIKKTSDFLDTNLHFIEPVLTLTIFVFFATLGRVIKHYRRGSLAIAAGMFFYSRNLKERQVNESEKFIRKEANECAHIHIMGASGWNTFGKPDSPLHQGLKTCNEAEIILLYPLSPALTKRARDISQGTEEYKQEIYNSLQYINELRGEGDNPERIKVRMYQSYPGWKYIFLGRYVWVQKYPPGDHVRNSPCYAFQRSPNEIGIYGQLFEQFKRRWESYRLGRYNFETDMLELYDENNRLTKKEPIR